METELARLAKRGLPLWNTLAFALLVLTLAAILHLGREVFVPVALAMLLSFILAPAVRALQRLRVPRGGAVAITVALAFGAMGILLFIMGSQLATLATDLPRYQTTIKEKVEALSSAHGPGASITRAVEAFTNFAAEVTETEPDGTPPLRRGAKPIPVVVQDDASLLGTLGLVVSPLLHPLAMGVLVLVFVLFVLAAREDLRNRFIRLVGTDDIQHTTAVIDDAGSRLSRLFLSQLAVNASFGVVIATALWLIGVPSAILWGIIAGIFRFVPYIGAFVGAIPPLALAFAIDPGWSMLIMTALLFAIVEPLVGHVIEPLVFGHSTGLSPLAVVLAAAIWTFLWGPIGLVLATPLTVCLVVLGRHVPSLNFLGVMLGDSPALSPPEIFYQRMLARDPAEAVAKARDFLRSRSLATYYDEIALEALRLAHEDVARGRLTPERQEAMRRSTGELIAQLDRIVTDPRPKGGQVGREAAAAVIAAGPDKGASTRVVEPADLRPEWRNGVPVLCVARPDSLDETVALMLVQVLRKHGLPAAFAPLSAEGRCDLDRMGEVTGIQMVCLSYMEPLSTLHLRHATRLARRIFAAKSVVIGIWRERDAGIARTLKRASRADYMAPTIGMVLSAAMTEATLPEAPALRDETPTRIGAE